MTIKVLLMLATIAASCASAAYAADPTTATPSASPQQSREQMALAHEKMATCLRSDRPLAECRSELMQACQHMKDKQGCGKNMMGRSDMPNTPEDSDAKAPSPPKHH